MFEKHFEHLVSVLKSHCRTLPGTILFVQWRAERSDFVRFNHGLLRQAGTVERHSAEFRMIQGQRVAVLQKNLTGAPAEDEIVIDEVLRVLTQRMPDAAEDPHLLINTVAAQSADSQADGTVDAQTAVQTVLDEARGHDLVGAWMSGPMAAGLWSSLGAQHFFERTSWSLDYSIYARSDATQSRRDKAVKATLAGGHWSAELVRDSIRKSLLQLEVLYRKPILLGPGSYRALLAPAAVGALIDMLCWGGFSARAELTGQSPLLKLRSGESSFSTLFSLAEDLHRIAAPRFQSDGFLRPVKTGLIHAGKAVDRFCSPRTASEFGIESNGAGNDEGPLALTMQGGSLAQADEMAALNQGLSISNLWYLNFSDRNNCRVTGMSRFATIWVENGQWLAPVVPMRFDDSLFSLLGEQLQDLGAEPVRLPELSSYDWRSSSAILAPSALIRAMRFTL